MRVAALILFSIAMSGPDVAGAQNVGRDRAAAQEPTEEIVVRGKRLADFRVEVEKARIRAYDIFNEINSSDDFDVQCRAEQRTGTRVGRHVCTARFETRISQRAARDYLFAMKDRCGSQVTQDCMFDPNKAGAGLLAAKAIEGEAPRQRALMDEEIHRLARSDLRFGQAILDLYEASLTYEEERNRPRERTRER